MSAGPKSRQGVPECGLDPKVVRNFSQVSGSLAPHDTFDTTLMDGCFSPVFPALSTPEVPDTFTISSPDPEHSERLHLKARHEKLQKFLMDCPLPVKVSCFKASEVQVQNRTSSRFPFDED